MDDTSSQATLDHFIDNYAEDENVPPSDGEEEYPDPAVPIPNFRCNARVFFLTYPRCPIPAQYALDKLREIIGPRLDFICVGHELHKDGGDHLHSVFQVKVIVWRKK